MNLISIYFQDMSAMALSQLEAIEGEIILHLAKFLHAPQTRCRLGFCFQSASRYHLRFYLMESVGTFGRHFANEWIGIEILWNPLLVTFYKKMYFSLANMLYIVQRAIACNTFTCIIIALNEILPRLVNMPPTLVWPIMYNFLQKITLLHRWQTCWCAQADDMKAIISGWFAQYYIYDMLNVLQNSFA